ncbi:MAG TPA: XRE family transcriptional regulator [Alphaproteobacteria bacterium]|nr:XRE family transcriptional regulator [Alphaproteobacteria bacterium]
MKAWEISRRIGEQIREARRGKGLTLRVLTQATGLSTPFLSRLERGAASTSIASLIRIAEALGIPLHDLFRDDGGARRPPSYVHVKRQARLTSPMVAAAGYTYEKLGDDLADQRLEAFELEFPVGAPQRILLVAHDGEEVLFLLSGRLEFQIGADRFVMDEGDCLHFDCRQPHMGRNIGTKPARMLMVVTTAPGNAAPPRWWHPPLKGKEARAGKPRSRNLHIRQK